MDIELVNEPDPTCCSDNVADICAQKLKVCGHPMRLKLLCRIAAQEDPCVSELWSCLDQPQPVISQHLAVLKQKGIVRSEVRGNRRLYSIVDPFIAMIIQSLRTTPPPAAPERKARRTRRLPVG